jgi:hypothetical protein
MNIHDHRQKGSALLVALVLGLALAITAGSFLSLALNTLNTTNRSFHYNTAFNLAESGLEEAMWALNNNDWTKRNWQESGQSMVLTGSFTSPDITSVNGVRGYFNVVVQQASGGAPTITAEGVVEQKNYGSTIHRQLRVSARNSNLFMPPFTAITSLILNGGQIDSYRMAEGNYSTAPRRYETTIASPAIAINDVSIGAPADIYGYVTVGVGSDHSAAYLNTIKGTVQGSSTETVAGAAGVLGSNTNNFIDTNRIAYDFTQDFPMPAAPTAAFLDTLPSADGNNMIILGDPTGATTKRYQLTNYSVPNGKTLLIVGPVEIKSLVGLKMAGQAAITVLSGTFTIPASGNGNNAVAAKTYTSTNASATIYAYGDLEISGNSALSGGTIPGTNVSTNPTKLQIMGMAPASQAFSTVGNGKLAAAVYAPHANMTFGGGGSSGCFAGAAVANTITVNGTGYNIRYPEEMADMNTATTYKISRWLDLVDRTTWYAFGN